VCVFGGDASYGTNDTQAMTPKWSPLLDGKVSVCGSHKKQTFLSSLIGFQTVEAHLSRNFPSSLLSFHLLSLETNKPLKRDKCKYFYKSFFKFEVIHYLEPGDPPLILNY
jgi:hypothetical protein